jgi:hypothetical protein
MREPGEEELLARFSRQTATTSEIYLNFERFVHYDDVPV